MSRSLLLLFFLVAALGCSSKSTTTNAENHSGGAGLTPGEVDLLRGDCRKMLESIQDLVPRRVNAQDCVPRCRPGADRSYRECGYRTTSGPLDHFLLKRLSDHLADMKERASAEQAALLEPIETALESIQFGVSLLPSEVTANLATSGHVKPPRQNTYVVVAKDTLHVGATSRARITPIGIEMLKRPGGGLSRKSSRLAESRSNRLEARRDGSC